MKGSAFARALVIVIAVALLVVGSLVRLAPLTSDQRTVASISEDGYLMLTVARNVALGRSLTIADGTIATNGIQPLVTFVWAGLHWMKGGDRLPALRSVIIVEFMVALLTALLVVMLARHAFAGKPWRDSAALLAGAFWFASPLAVKHTTNGLETGFSVCAIAAVLLIDARWRERTITRAMVLGGLLGVLFLIRNDAVFLIFAFLLLEVVGDGPPARRLRDVAMSGIAALVVASPWLAYNLRVFGNVIPVSGRAQNLGLATGENLVAVPRALGEFAWMATPLPATLGQEWWGALLTGLVFIAVVVGTWQRWRRHELPVVRWMKVVLLHSALLALYYGVFFGASYFLTRYLFALSLVAMLVPWVWLMPVASHSPEDRTLPNLAGLLVAAGLALLVMAAVARIYSRSAEHDHGQVLEWVLEHVMPEEWVGAPQSGTVGYFHDRTVNLDGKVNPRALQARRDNRLFHYIVDDTPIEYIADWYGLVRWIDRPESVREERDVDLLKRNFDVIVREPQRNLIVLRRQQRR